MSSESLRTRIENNVALWALGTLLAGFSAGIAAYAAVVSMSGQVIVPAEKLVRLEETASALEEQVTALQADRAASAAPDKPSEPARISFESTTSGERSPIINTVERDK